MMKTMLRKVTKRALMGIFLVALVAAMLLLSSYLSRWTPASSHEIPSMCFVAVNEETSFIPFNELSTEKPSDKAVWEDSQDRQYWKLTTREGIKQVYYSHNNDFSWFEYRIIDHAVQPISCQLIGPGTAILGGFLALLVLLFLNVARSIYRWRERRIKA